MAGGLVSTCQLMPEPYARNWARTASTGARGCNAPFDPIYKSLKAGVLIDSISSEGGTRLRLGDAETGLLVTVETLSRRK